MRIWRRFTTVSARPGDFYDFVRVSPDRVVFGMLDVAGRVEESRAILSSAQQVFRARSCDLLAAGGRQ